MLTFLIQAWKFRWQQPLFKNVISPGCAHLHVCTCAKSLQSWKTLCDPIDYSPPDSSVCGILQAKILEWLPCLPPGHLPHPGIQPESLMSPALAGRFLTTSATWEAPVHTSYTKCLLYSKIKCKLKTKQNAERVHILFLNTILIVFYVIFSLRIVWSKTLEYLILILLTFTESGTTDEKEQCFTHAAYSLLFWNNRTLLRIHM